MGVSHRILTMYDGRITGEFDGSTVTEDDLITASIGGAAAEGGSDPSQAGDAGDDGDASGAASTP